MVLSSQAKLHVQSLGYQICSYCRAALTAGHGGNQTQHGLFHADLLEGLDKHQAAPTNMAATLQEERVAGELLMLLAVVISVTAMSHDSANFCQQTLLSHCES